MAEHKIIFDHFIKQRPFAWKRQGTAGKFRWRDSKEMQQAKDTLGWEVKAAQPSLRCDDKARFGFRALFYVRDPCDGDNLIKLLMDALEGIVWTSDEQVDEGSFSKRIDREPGLKLIIWRIEP